MFRFARSTAAAPILVVVLATGWATAQYDPRLQYQRRGHRDEGLRTVAVGGFDVELMSARIEPTPSATAFNPPKGRAWKEHLVARFFVPELGPALLRIRQTRSQSGYYWLTFPTRSEPALASAWKAGRTNEYAWPTADVLANLREVTLDDLGALVTFGESASTNIQHALPVGLFDQEPIEVATAYRFTFRAPRKVNVSATITRDGPPLLTRARTWEEADSPFTVRWAPANAPDGWYKLALTGFFDNNAPLNREVRFYHRTHLSNAVRLDSR